MITKQDVIIALKEEERSGMNYEELLSTLGVETKGDEQEAGIALLEALICGDVTCFYYDGDEPDTIFQVRIVECESCGYEVLRSELASCDNTGEEVCPFCALRCEECGAQLHPEALHVSEDGDEFCSVCIQHADSWGDGDLE